MGSLILIHEISEILCLTVPDYADTVLDRLFSLKALTVRFNCLF